MGAARPSEVGLRPWMEVRWRMYRSASRPRSTTTGKDGGGSRSCTPPPTAASERTCARGRLVLTSVRSLVPWGATLTIRGRVLGGYIPGGQILRVLSGTGKHLHLLGEPDDQAGRALHRTPSGSRQRRSAEDGGGGGHSQRARLPVGARIIETHSDHYRLRRSDFRSCRAMGQRTAISVRSLYGGRSAI
jgi:hypothetical protein